MSYWLTGLLLVIVIAVAGLSATSRKAPELGLIDGQLTPCPDSPNCVSSEDADRPSFIPPLPFEDPPDQSWAKARKAVQQAGGKILQENDHYLHAVFTSRLLRFRDDLELRHDTNRGVIHIRSASRTGHSDFGVNRKRAKLIKTLYCGRVDQAGSDGYC